MIGRWKMTWRVWGCQRRPPWIRFAPYLHQTLRRAFLLLKRRAQTARRTPSSPDRARSQIEAQHSAVARHKSIPTIARSKQQIRREFRQMAAKAFDKKGGAPSSARSRPMPTRACCTPCHFASPRRRACFALFVHTHCARCDACSSRGLAYSDFSPPRVPQSTTRRSAPAASQSTASWLCGRRLPRQSTLSPM